jgi:hypothetical protein
LAATALQSRKPAGRNAQERLQNRHVTRAMRGMCVGGRLEEIEVFDVAVAMSAKRGAQAG